MICPGRGSPEATPDAKPVPYEMKVSPARHAGLSGFAVTFPPIGPAGLTVFGGVRMADALLPNLYAVPCHTRSVSERETGKLRRHEQATRLFPRRCQIFPLRRCHAAQPRKRPLPDTQRRQAQRQIEGKTQAARACPHTARTVKIGGAGENSESVGCADTRLAARSAAAALRARIILRGARRLACAQREHNDTATAQLESATGVSATFACRC